jgi:hypothetical protein
MNTEHTGTAIKSATPKVNIAKNTHKDIIQIQPIRYAEKTLAKFLKNSITLLPSATNIFRPSTVIYGSHAKNNELRTVRKTIIISIATTGISMGISNTAEREKYKTISVTISYMANATVFTSEYNTDFENCEIYETQNPGFALSLIIP